MGDFYPNFLLLKGITLLSPLPFSQLHTHIFLLVLVSWIGSTTTTKKVMLAFPCWFKQLNPPVKDCWRTSKRWVLELLSWMLSIWWNFTFQEALCCWAGLFSVFFFLGGGYQAQIYFAYGFSLLLHHLMPLFHLVLRNCIFSSRLRMKGKICNKRGWCCGFCCCYSKVVATVSACCCCHVG